MFLLYFLIISCVILGILLYITNFDFSKIKVNNYLIIIISGFLIRIVFSKIFPGFSGDLDSFKNAAMYIFRENPADFYKMYDFNYFPPFYMYILYLVGFIQTVFGLEFEGFLFSTLVKLPAMTVDIMTAIFIYRIMYKNSTEKRALIISLIYVLNPAIIIISSIWGQYDSIFAYFLLVSIYSLTNKDYLKGFVFYSFAVLSKPMSVIYLPIFIFALYLYMKEVNFNLKYFFKIIGAVIFLFIFLLIPFYGSLDFKLIYNQITEKSMSYASINAYNLWTFLGANWITLKADFLWLNYEVWGNIFLTVSIIFSFAIVSSIKHKGKYFISAAFTSVMYFIFATKMHERYFFVSLVLLLMLFIYFRKRIFLLLYGLFSATFLINCMDVIYLSLNDNKQELIKYSMSIFSFCNLILTSIFIYVVYKCCVTCKESVIIQKEVVPFIKIDIDKVKIEHSEKIPKFTKKDYIYICAITLIYAVVGFYKLGNTYAPQTRFETYENNTEVFVEFDSVVNIKRIQCYLGPRTEKKVMYSASIDGSTWFSNDILELESVFSWRDAEVDLEGKYFKISFADIDTMIMELAIRDADDNLIKINTVSDNGKYLFDEQNMVPKAYNYMNSSYFDEVYHPRTAYEFVEKLDVYEWTHPQLGKDIMSLGILAFGMTPFGWRFTGTLIGVLMVPLLYLFAKRMFKNSNWALFATVIFSFDFMHFVQTRIGTIDSYVTFFIIGMYYFMYKYYKTSFYDTALYKTLIYLFMSGIFTACAVSSKWQGVYAILGIAVIFFITLYKRFMEYLYCKKNNLSYADSFIKNTAITLCFCVLFFIIIPLSVYIVTYIPHYIADKNSSFMNELIEQNGNVNLLTFIWETQKRIFNYHAHLGDEHVFSSRWYKWLINIRPMAFYRDYPSENMRADIITFGNPAVWWGGLVALFYAFKTIIERKSKTLNFLLIAYFSQLVPWMLITTRTTFVYHYFPCIPFLVLLITYFFKDYVINKNKTYVYAYVCIVLVLFLMFFPVLAGIPVPTNYINNFLRWFSTW